MSLFSPACPPLLPKDHSLPFFFHHKKQAVCLLFKHLFRHTKLIYLWRYLVQLFKITYRPILLLKFSSSAILKHWFFNSQARMTKNLVFIQFSCSVVSTLLIHGL